MSCEQLIVCDACHSGGISAKKASEARAVLKRHEGWDVDLPGGKDYCRDCAQQHRILGVSTGDTDG